MNIWFHLIIKKMMFDATLQFKFLNMQEVLMLITNMVKQTLIKTLLGLKKKQGETSPILSNSSNTGKNKPKFDPKTWKPFDKVLVRCHDNSDWFCNIFSHIEPYGDFCFCSNGTSYKMCIPYNEETKNLVGTSDEAPEYYRYWED